MSDKQYGEAHELPKGFLGGMNADNTPNFKSMFGDGPKRRLRPAPEVPADDEPEAEMAAEPSVAETTPAVPAPAKLEASVPKKARRKASAETSAEASSVGPLDRPKAGGFYIRAKDAPEISAYVKQKRLTNWDFLVEAFRATKAEWSQMFRPTLGDEDLFEPRATGRRAADEPLTFWNVRNTRSDLARIDKWVEQHGAKSRSEFVSAVFERYLKMLNAG